MADMSKGDPSLNKRVRRRICGAAICLRVRRSSRLCVRMAWRVAKERACVCVCEREKERDRGGVFCGWVWIVEVEVEVVGRGSFFFFFF